MSLFAMLPPAPFAILPPPAFDIPPPAPYVVPPSVPFAVDPEYSDEFSSGSGDEDRSVGDEDSISDVSEVKREVTGISDVDELMKIPQFPRTREQAISVMNIASMIREQRTARIRVTEHGVRQAAILAALWDEEREAAIAAARQADEGIDTLRSTIQRMGIQLGPEIPDPSVQQGVDKGKGREVTFRL
ncbi:hypothetical protein EVG20_g10015 [Dentipellis fragilis]|uniref:Uncharacterized protein n=1 Tax=Dentipellis fragilis TaxID=205917 RepID=A0A4Y9XYK8_9AGAM|nr:hypothetical protein EVG20_g10015 [Dentipellis fragilis]